MLNFAAALLLLGSPSYVPGPPSTVPLEVLASKHIAVQVKLNGQGPYRLVLDTGSPVSFINTMLAKDLGLVGESATPGLIMRFPTSIDLVDVGGAQVKNLTFLIMDHPTIEMMAQVDGRMDGIVGFSFFARFRTTIDYAAGTASFVPVPYKPGDVMESIMSSLMGGSSGPRMIAPRGLWGLTIASIPGESAVLVKRVFARSAAELAGILVGDKVTTIDGRWTASLADAFDAASFVKPGATASLTILRDGKETTLTLQPRLGI